MRRAIKSEKTMLRYELIGAMGLRYRVLYALSALAELWPIVPVALMLLVIGLVFIMPSEGELKSIVVGGR